MKVSILLAVAALAAHLLLERGKLLVIDVDQGHEMFAADVASQVRAAAPAAADDHATHLIAGICGMEDVRAGKELLGRQGARGQRGTLQEGTTIESIFHGWYPGN